MTFADTNLMELARVKEVTWGVTPGSGYSQKLRVTGQGLDFGIQYIRSEEIRSDRMTADLVQVDAEPSGSIPVEMSYGNADDFLEGALFSTWTKTAEIINSAPDTEITQVDNATDTFTVAANGDDFFAGHLVKTSGFTNTENNLVFRVASSTGTTVVGSALTLVDEAAPPAGATIKAVGIEGASCDLAAVTAGGNGITTSALDFTDFGLAPGMWIKIGGTATITKFATTALNGWARISAVTTTKITFDRVPTGWGADAGAAKTIRIFFGDYMKNGVTRHSWTLERNHTDITQYLSFAGMMVNQMNFNIQTGAILTAEMMFMGKSADRDVVSILPGTINAAPTGDVMNSVRDVVSVLENGTNAGTIQSMTLQLANNLRGQKAVGFLGNAGIGVGDFEVTGDLTAYFEDGTIYDRYVNDTDTSLSFIVTNDGQGYSFDIPRVKIESCTIQAGARNQDATLQMTYRGILNATLNAQLILNRFPYFEV